MSPLILTLALLAPGQCPGGACPTGYAYAPAYAIPTYAVPAPAYYRTPAPYYRTAPGYYRTPAYAPAPAVIYQAPAQSRPVVIYRYR